MEPVYVDIHIHASSNPDSLNTNYNIDTLFAKFRTQTQGQAVLLSRTDHNTIGDVPIGNTRYREKCISEALFVKY